MKSPRWGRACRFFPPSVRSSTLHVDTRKVLACPLLLNEADSLLSPISYLFGDQPCIDTYCDPSLSPSHHASDPSLFHALAPIANTRRLVPSVSAHGTGSSCNSLRETTEQMAHRLWVDFPGSEHKPFHVCQDERPSFCLHSV